MRRLVLHALASWVLAAVLAAAAAAKLAHPRASRDALGSLTAAAGRDAWILWSGVVALELVLAAGLALQRDAAALAASVTMFAFGAALTRALWAGHAGAPCGCFGARSRVSRFAVGRAVALGLALAVVPLLPRDDLATDTWLTLGLALALTAVAVLGVAVLALAREVGLLRLALGPQAALEVPEEGPPLGSDSGLSTHLDPRPGAPLGLAVFTSEGCRLCRLLEPQVAALARDPHVDVVVLDEVRDADHWARLAVPGSPYAVAIDRSGRVLAKGTFNSLGQLESVLATAERRMVAHA